MNITRRHNLILLALCDNKHHHICELAYTLDMSTDTIHHLLNDLVRDGKVEKEPGIFPGVYFYRLA